MSVLSKALLTLVRSHFVLLSFFSARHINVLNCFPLHREVKKFILNLPDKNQRWPEPRDPCPFVLLSQIVSEPFPFHRCSSVQVPEVVAPGCARDLFQSAPQAARSPCHTGPTVSTACPC